MEEEFEVGEHKFILINNNLSLESYVYSYEVISKITKEKAKEIIEFLAKFVEGEKNVFIKTKKRNIHRNSKNIKRYKSPLIARR